MLPMDIVTIVNSAVFGIFILVLCLNVMASLFLSVIVVVVTARYGQPARPQSTVTMVEKGTA